MRIETKIYSHKKLCHYLQQDASSDHDSQATQHEIRAVFHSEAKVVTQNWIHQSIQNHIVGIQYVIAHCQK